MDFIKNWVLIIVSAAVVGSVALLLCPSGNMEKTVKTVISIFMLSAIVMPFASSGFMELDLRQYNEISGEAYKENSGEILKEITTDEIENLIKKSLNDNSIAYDDIMAVVSEYDNVINIEEIVLTVTDGSGTETANAVKLIKEIIGNDVNVEVVND